MTVPLNVFGLIQSLEAVLSSNYMYEKRLTNDEDGKTLFVGFNITPNAPTSGTGWFVLKFGYDENGFLNRVQLPDNGIGFLYIYDDIESYFS